MEHHFNIYVAKDYGIEEAILLHNFYFWLSKNAANEKHFHDGLYWFYNSKKAFVDLFPYMNETKIFRSIKKLEEKGIVVKGNFNEDKFVKTNWYAITKKGLLYLRSKGYSISDFSASLQNDTIDSVKMNDGALQNEQSILINNNTDTNTNNIQEKEDIIISSKKKAKKELDMSIVAPNMLEPVETWLAYKKEKAQSYKPTGFKTFYKKLCELSGNNPQVAMAIIEQSMSNNYAGIFPLKNNNNNYGRETVTDRIKRTLANAEEFKKRIDASIGKQAEMDFGDEKDVW
jgi:DNA-binding PadR family transcriptional regulator